MTDSAVTPPQAAPAQDASQALPPGSDSAVSFGGDFYIHPGKRLQYLDQGPVKAYAASTLSDVPTATHYALVCEPHLIPRTSGVTAFMTLNNPNLVHLVGAGPLHWPPVRGERYVFIYEIPPSRPLTPEGQFRGLDMKADLVHTAVVKPLVHALVDMRDTDIVHGNIRPSNLFPVGPQNSIDRVVLGECLSTPPSYNQTAIFETIERAMADPIARDHPRIEDDLYALGVTLAILLRSRDPMEGMSNEEIIRYKIENGSYIALTGKDRFTGVILELLRGLLNDDTAMRWTLEDVLSWLDGQRLNAKTGSKKVKAARPLYFRDERYLRPPLLAMDLAGAQAEAAQLIESGHLEQWVSRSLDDSSIEKRLESALESVAEHGRGPGYTERLLCRVSIALDPDAPIRYKGQSMHPEGVGNALAEAMITKKDLSPYMDLINQQIILFWLTSQGDSKVDVGAIATKFDSCRAFLRQNSIAYGIERCLYFLNPDCPCLSDKVKGYYVRNTEDLMQAFERISARSDRPELFFDRHIIAFMSVKDRKDIDPYLMELNAEGMPRRILGNIKTLATIQQRARMDKFPGICKWISEILEPVYAHYHDRDLQKAMRAKVGQLIDKGDIARIVGVLDNRQTVQQDTDLFNQARTQYYNMRVEDAQLEEKLGNPVLFNKGIGREIAAVVACLISGVTILFFLFMFFVKGGL